MGNKHLSNKPKGIKGNPHAWWYEEAGGIEIIHEILVAGDYKRTDHILIPWKQIRTALERKDAK